jgi:hypothetical protein
MVLLLFSKRSLLNFINQSAIQVILLNGKRFIFVGGKETMQH